MATPATKHPAVVDVITARAELLRFLESVSDHDSDQWLRTRAAIELLLQQHSACRPSQPRTEWRSRPADSLNHPGNELVIDYGGIEAVVHSNSMREVPGSSGHECAFTIYAEPQRPPGADGTHYGRSILASGSVWSSHNAQAAAQRMAELVIEGHLARVAPTDTGARAALLELSQEILGLDSFYELRTRSYPPLGGPSSVLAQLAIKARQMSGVRCVHPCASRARNLGRNIAFQCTECRYIHYTAAHCADVGIEQAPIAGEDG